MFAPGFVTLFFVALFAVNVAGYPVPEPLRVRCYPSMWLYTADGFVSVPWLNAVRRRLNPYKLISTVTLFVCVASNCITITEHFSQHVEPYVKRQGNINTIPEELPTKAPNGVLEAYVKRQGNINTIPEELPTKAPNGVLEAYVKRQGNINTIPEELPTKAPNGVLEAYVKRQSNINTIPEELPTKAPNGVLEAY
jgi:hypothetical protein